MILHRSGKSPVLPYEVNFINNTFLNIQLNEPSKSFSIFLESLTGGKLN